MLVGFCVSNMKPQKINAEEPEKKFVFSLNDTKFIDALCRWRKAKLEYEEVRKPKNFDKLDRQNQILKSITTDQECKDSQRNLDKLLTAHDFDLQKRICVAEFETKRRQIDLEFTLEEIKKGNQLAKEHLPEVTDNFKKAFDEYEKLVKEQKTRVQNQPY